MSDIFTDNSWWSSKTRDAHVLPLPQWMEPVPDCWYSCTEDEERRALILERHARQQAELQAVGVVVKKRHA